ncbi:Small ubiquitin- modifier 1 [Clydaea vesicula]|uniref:Small ubiquitin- modifier 1 n=1 Tax=Clydaea vesicula TaxID=447962 RepID=A0AAD5XX88_9FUNG|nr:Small ubiquitin- modifier 1 [Clydaea vesicula]
MRLRGESTPEDNEMEDGDVINAMNTQTGGADAGPATEVVKAEHLNLKVESSDGTQVSFKIKKATPFEKLFNAYAQKIGSDRNSIRFSFDGVRVEGHQTPESLEMEEEDVIHATVHQVGGCISVA